MNKLSKQQYINKNINAKTFATLEQLLLLQNTIFPKITGTFEGKYKKLWEDKINSVLPKNHLNFKSEDNYLNNTKITKNEVIKNSILYCLPNLEDNDVNYLIKYFSIFTKFNKIKVFIEENKITPVYNEIINILNYIKNIEKIFEEYPKNYGNHLGTKFRSSSYESLVKNRINILKDRLDDDFFSIDNDEEVRKTKIQIKFMEYSLIEEYKNLPEWMNFINIFVGFKDKSFDMSNIQIKAFEQLCTFFNGIKTSKEEILKSVSIYLRTQSNIKNEDIELHKELADNIKNILMFFFQDTIIEIEKTKEKRTFTYSQNDINKNYHIKTYLSQIPIYTYTNKNSIDSFNELFQIGIKSILGIQTIFDIENSDNKEASDFQILKNIMSFRKDLNLTKKEYKTFLFFIQNTINNQIN